MKTKINFKNAIIIFLVVLAIILVFTFFDYLTHLLSKEYAVPSYYFRNKIIFGTLIGLIAYYFTRDLVFWKKSLIFSASVSALLQIRYTIEGYPLDFVILFLFIHFTILLAVSMIAFKLTERFKLHKI